jgi:hypothetical protein
LLDTHDALAPILVVFLRSWRAATRRLSGEARQPSADLGKITGSDPKTTASRRQRRSD